jgi:hypothetical protein
MASAYRDYLESLEEKERGGVLGWISSMGKETGSVLLDVLSQLDRPRNALWL